VLLPDGTIAAGAKSRMEEEFLLEALRWMMKSRLYDQRVIALQRQGQFGVFSPGTGQEASIIARRWPSIRAGTGWCPSTAS